MPHSDCACTAAHTVIEQDADIVDLFQEVNDHHHDLLRVMEERNQQAAQIERVRESLREAMEDSEIGGDHYPEDYCTGRVHAFAMALRLIEEIQGDSDD